MTELGEQWRPDGGALRHAVEQDDRRAAPMREHPYPQACPREFDEELLDVRAGGGKQVPFRVADAPLQIPGPPGLIVHDFSFRPAPALPGLAVMAARLASHARTVRSSSRLRSASAARSAARTRRVAVSRHSRPRLIGRTSTTR